MTLVVCASFFAGCGPARVESYGVLELERLEVGQPAPWSGWLLSDEYFEMLVKTAVGAEDVR